MSRKTPDGPKASRRRLLRQWRDLTRAAELLRGEVASARQDRGLERMESILALVHLEEAVAFLKRVRPRRTPVH